MLSAHRLPPLLHPQSGSPSSCAGAGAGAGRKAPTLCLGRWSLAVCLGDNSILPLSGCAVLVQEQAQGPGKVASSRYQKRERDQSHSSSSRETGHLTATHHTPDQHGGIGARPHVPERAAARGGGASQCLLFTAHKRSSLCRPDTRDMLGCGGKRVAGSHLDLPVSFGRQRHVRRARMPFADFL